MIWSEKLACDVYTTLASDYAGVVEFSNIAATEQIHMTKLIDMLNKQSFQPPDPEPDLDPTIDADAGEFPYPELQDLYDRIDDISLLEEADQLAAALQLSIDIETLLKTSYEDILAATFEVDGNVVYVVTNPSLINLYNNLKLSSDNHLSVFNAL